jgi:hypothetical protein
MDVGEPGSTLSFSLPVRILLPGEALHRVGFRTPGGVPTEITLTCDSATAPTNIPAGKECKTAAGGDLIVWSAHMTTFFTFTPAAGGPTQTVGVGSIDGWLPVLAAVAFALFLILAWRNKKVRYVAFLWIVDAGGGKTFEPVQLRKWLEDEKFVDVVTSETSHDVVFTSKLKSSQDVEKKVAKLLKTRMETEIGVVIRSRAEMKDVMKRAPFEGYPAHDEQFRVTFLQRSETFAVTKLSDGPPIDQRGAVDMTQAATVTRNWAVVKILIDQVEGKS